MNIIENNEIKTILIKMNFNSGNSFTLENLSKLYDVFISYEDKENFNSVIITGNDRNFSFGGDIFEMKKMMESGQRSSYVESIVPLVNKLILKILSYPIPVIAAMNGTSAGGGIGIGLSCDHKIITKETKFALAFGSLGLTPDSSTSYFFVKEFGLSKALVGVLNGDVLEFKDFEKMSFYDKIIDSDDLENQALNIAKRYSKLNRDLIKRTKILLNHTKIQELKPVLEKEYESIKNASNTDFFIDRLENMIKKMKAN